MNFQAFAQDGYQVIKDFLPQQQVADLRACVFAALDPLLAPVEYEADTGYPGAPLNRSATGGLTPRRLLSAYARDPRWRALATSQTLADMLVELLGEQALLSQSHHNCIMTKHPGFSSRTLWHQDIRYWSFARPDLVSAWIALTDEHKGNGGLQLIPGSHQMTLPQERFDSRLFLQPEHADNAELIATAEPVALSAGDLLLFHCRTFHAAGTNDTDDVKLSAVFTYHGQSNQPQPETRSSLYPSVGL